MSVNKNVLFQVFEHLFSWNCTNAMWSEEENQKLSRAWLYNQSSSKGIVIFCSRNKRNCHFALSSRLNSCIKECSVKTAKQKPATISSAMLRVKNRFKTANNSINQTIFVQCWQNVFFLLYRIIELHVRAEC